MNDFPFKAPATIENFFLFGLNNVGPILPVFLSVYAWPYIMKHKWYIIENLTGAQSASCNNS